MILTLWCLTQMVVQWFCWIRLLILLDNFISFKEHYYTYIYICVYMCIEEYKHFVWFKKKKGIKFSFLIRSSRSVAEFSLGRYSRYVLDNLWFRLLHLFLVLHLEFLITGGRNFRMRSGIQSFLRFHAISILRLFQRGKQVLLRIQRDQLEKLLLLG